MKNTREENYERITISSETEVKIWELESSIEFMTKEIHDKEEVIKKNKHDLEKI